MQNQINTSPFSQFAQILRAAEQAQSKELKLPIHQARALNLALLEVLSKLTQDYESLFNELRKNKDSEVISVTMDGGTFNKE